MISEAGSQHALPWAAITPIMTKTGRTRETLRRWIRQHERDTGQRSGPTIAEDGRVKDSSVQYTNR